MTPILRSIALCTLFSCASADLLGSNTDQETDPTDPIDTDPPPLSSYLDVQGSLDIREGSLVMAQVRVSLFEDEGDGPVERCGALHEVDDVALHPAPVDPVQPYGLWSFALPAVVGCEDLPTNLVLGVGPLVADLWPYTTAQGHSTEGTRGLYTVSPDGEELWVFGIAGTEAQLAGTDPGTTPMPDGDYLARGAFLIPL